MTVSIGEAFQYVVIVISSPVFRDLQHSSVRTCALATLCITTLSARVGEVCSIKSIVYTERTSGCYTGDEDTTLD